MTAVHPRAGGERARMTVHQAQVSGSSPLGRGTLPVSSWSSYNRLGTHEIVGILHMLYLPASTGVTRDQTRPLVGLLDSV